MYTGMSEMNICLKLVGMQCLYEQDKYVRLWINFTSCGPADGLQMTI